MVGQYIAKLASQQRGAVALEALLSIIILLFMTSVTWGICILVFNYSIISTSTQLATQSALLSYDRSSFRGVDNNAQEQQAQNVASKVFRQNSCGTLRGQFGETAPDGGCLDASAYTPSDLYRINFTCSSIQTLNWQNCNIGGLTNSWILRAESRAQLRIPFSYLLTDSRLSGGVNADVSAEAYSFTDTGELLEGGP